MSETPPAASDPGWAGERTELAWTRTALNLAASGTLISRAGFAAHLELLGALSAIIATAVAYATWQHGHRLYGQRLPAADRAQPQTRSFRLLTAATLLTGTAAVAVTIAL